MSSDSDPEREKRHTISLCMGSACHQLGVYDLLPLLEALLDKHGLKEDVELEGAFCLGPCRHGIVMHVDSVELLELNAKNIQRRFEKDILPLLTKAPEETPA